MGCGGGSQCSGFVGGGAILQAGGNDAPTAREPVVSADLPRNNNNDIVYGAMLMESERKTDGPQVGHQPLLGESVRTG